MHVFLVIAMLLSGLGGTAATVAAQESLPGEALYGLKTATEQVKLTVAFSDESKAAVWRDIVAARGEEMGKALEKHNDRAAADAAIGFADAIAKADGKGKDQESGAGNPGQKAQPVATLTPVTSAGAVDVSLTGPCDAFPGHSERGVLAKLRARDAAAGRGRQNVVDNLARVIEKQLAKRGLTSGDVAALISCAETSTAPSSEQSPATGSPQTDEDQSKNKEKTGTPNPRPTQTPAAFLTPTPPAGASQGLNGPDPARGASKADDGPGQGKDKSRNPNASQPRG